MKQTYIVPQMFVTQVAAQQMIAASITGTFSDETYSGDAGVKESSNPFGETIFDD